MLNFSTNTSRVIGLSALAVVIVAVVIAITLIGGDDDPATVPVPSQPTPIPPTPPPTSTPIVSVQPTPTVASTPTVAPTPTVADPQRPTSMPVPPSPTPEPTVPVGAQLAATKALALAAVSSAASHDDSEVESVTATVWPNTALGCQVPGTLYAEVEVPGWIIELSVGGEMVVYHSDTAGDQVVSCGAVTEITALPSLNVMAETGISGATEVVIYGLPPGEDPAEMVRIDDPSLAATFADALAGPVYVRPATECDAVFRVDITGPNGSASFLYACAGAGDVLGGDQAFWDDGEGIAPAEFQRLVNQALANRDLPILPPNS